MMTQEQRAKLAQIRKRAEVHSANYRSHSGIVDVNYSSHATGREREGEIASDGTLTARNVYEYR